MEDDPKQLEDMIIEDIRKLYSDTVIEHCLNPRNQGEIPNPDGYAKMTGPCGDTMAIWLRIKNDNVTDAKFWTDGCGPSIAAGSMTTELVKGKGISDALHIGKDDVLNSLGSLPADSEHCALLAANALRAALQDYMALKKEPWKKAYRST